MSGTEFSLIVGLVSGTITIVDSIVKICSQARKGGLPNGFRDIAQKLPLIRETLRVVEERLTDDIPTDLPRGAIEEFAQDCKNKVTHLELVCSKCISEPCTSRLDRLVTSAKAHLQSAKVVSLTKDLLEHVQLLAQLLAIQEPSRKQIQEIETAIKKLSPRAYSTGLQHNAAGNYTRIVHLGRGTQNIHSSSGDQNVILGSGIQYIGHEQLFSE